MFQGLPQMPSRCPHYPHPMRMTMSAVSCQDRAGFRLIHVTLFQAGLYVSSRQFSDHAARKPLDRARYRSSARQQTTFKFRSIDRMRTSNLRTIHNSLINLCFQMFSSSIPGSQDDDYSMHPVLHCEMLMLVEAARFSRD
jgi:hypothetical protein